MAIAWAELAQLGKKAQHAGRESDVWAEFFGFIRYLDINSGGQVKECLSANRKDEAICLLLVRLIIEMKEFRFMVEPKKDMKGKSLDELFELIDLLIRHCEKYARSKAKTK